jgi:DNA-binding response OmpR family regulator
MPQKILIIEDDADIAHLLDLHLRDIGYEVTVAPDGKTGLERALSSPFDLIILDLMLPGIDGLEICRRLRGKAGYPSILMLTCKSSELDRVLGLEIGADDYLTKPFSIRELQARVKALLRRMEALKAGTGTGHSEKIKAGELAVDMEKRKVTLSGHLVNLTPKEFDLLVFLARQPGRVFTRAQLLDMVWGLGYEGYAHTVNSHINRLRSKIEKDPSHPRYILTVRGVGYRFTEG